jgi:hypothetical protein
MVSLVKEFSLTYRLLWAASLALEGIDLYGEFRSGKAQQEQTNGHVLATYNGNQAPREPQGGALIPADDEVG